MVGAARVALALYLLAGAAITLGPTPGRLFGSGNRAVRDLTDGALSSAAIEAGANVLLFVPLGFLLGLSLPRVSRVLLWAVCAAASAAIELYQYAFPGRDASVRDLVMNSLGAAIGVALSWLVIRVVDRRQDQRSG
jgi:glycopeptide antibiotics resistance protein